MKRSREEIEEERVLCWLLDWMPPPPQATIQSPTPSSELPALMEPSSATPVFPEVTEESSAAGGGGRPSVAAGPGT